MRVISRPCVSCPSKDFNAWLPAGEWSPAAAGCGVLSAADTGYFPGLQLLVMSLRGRYPVAAVDLGLDQLQRDWLRLAGVQVLTVDPSCWLVPRSASASMWQTWNKPLWLASSPFERTLWLDADCLVVGDLAPLFDLMLTGPLLLAHPSDGLAQVRNADALYTVMSVPRRLECGSLQAGVVGVNASVWGWLLGCWGVCVSRVWDKAYPFTTSCWDQGALTWAVESVGLADRVIVCDAWNRFCWRGAASLATDVMQFLDLVQFVAGDVVLHFVDRVKYWSEWGSYVSVV